MARSPPYHPDAGGPRTSSTAARSSPEATASIRRRSIRPPSLSAPAPGSLRRLLDPVDPDRTGLELRRARLRVPGIDRQGVRVHVVGEVQGHEGQAGAKRAINVYRGLDLSSPGGHDHPLILRHARPLRVFRRDTHRLLAPKW